MRHDCVVVPGFGAFLAQNEPARRDASGNWVPPMRSVSFNAGVRHDDGLLCTSVGRRQGVSYDAAKNIVANDVALLRQSLESAGSVEISRIGRFALVDGMTLFDPSVDQSIIANRYLGLPSVVYQPVVDERVSGEEEAMLDVPVHRNRVGAWLKVAASVAVLLGLGVTLTTPVSVDRSELQYASVGAPNLSLPTATIVFDRHKSEGSLVSIRPIESEATAKVVEQSAAVIDKASSVSSIIDAPVSGRHYVIVASCETKAKAIRFIDRRAGSGLRMLPSDGRFRIYAASAETLAKAEELRNTLRSSYRDAWVYTSR